MHGITAQLSVHGRTRLRPPHERKTQQAEPARNKAREAQIPLTHRVDRLGTESTELCMRARSVRSVTHSICKRTAAKRAGDAGVCVPGNRRGSEERVGEGVSWFG